MTLETAGDLDREARIGARISAAWHVTLCKMPGPYPIDWYAERQGRVIAWVELKTATYPSDRYGTAVISLRKLEELLGHSAWGRAGLFVVAFTDGAWYIEAREIDKSHAEVLARRHNRRPEDTEPVVKVPLTDMRCLWRGEL